MTEVHLALNVSFWYRQLFFNFLGLCNFWCRLRIWRKMKNNIFDHILSPSKGYTSFLIRRFKIQNDVYRFYTKIKNTLYLVFFYIHEKHTKWKIYTLFLLYKRRIRKYTIIFLHAIIFCEFGRQICLLWSE